MDAFERAEKFFQETFEAFVCESWLVSPKLKELLGEDSNIIKFMGLFENYGIVYPSGGTAGVWGNLRTKRGISRTYFFAESIKEIRSEWKGTGNGTRGAPSRREAKLITESEQFRDQFCYCYTSSAIRETPT